MTTRRQFLSQAAWLPAAATSATAAQSPAARDATPLPQSIAALTSMRDRAHPITTDERRTRLERARRLMTDQKIDALLLTGGTSAIYFSGARLGGSERIS